MRIFSFLAFLLSIAAKARSVDSSFNFSKMQCYLEVAVQVKFIFLEVYTRTYEGRVTICRNGVWGTVCDDSWDSNDARVVCRQLGYVTSGKNICPFLLLICFAGATVFSNALFGEGTGSIFMDDVSCSGFESQLRSCSYTSSHNCRHSEDASVQCSSTRATPSRG